MKITHIQQADEIPANQSTVLALGYFDGLHQGHEALIKEAKKLAQQNDLELVLLTFPESPRLLFEKFREEMLLHLLSSKEMAKRLEVLGVDHLIYQDFTTHFASLNADEFIEQYVTAFHPRYVVAGFDYRMGRDQLTLAQWQESHLEAPFDYIIVPEISDEKGKISSTRMRQSLVQGDVSDVMVQLGRPYQTRGIVVHGDARGRTIGFPTANVAPLDRVHLPADGVYVTDVRVGDKTYRAMTSLGKNTTFGGTQLRLENHLLEFSDDIYGQEITIFWLTKIRDMVTFDSVEALIAQLNADRDFTRKFS